MNRAWWIAGGVMGLGIAFGVGVLGSVRRTAPETGIRAKASSGESPVVRRRQEESERAKAEALAKAGAERDAQALARASAERTASQAEDARPPLAARPDPLPQTPPQVQPSATTEMTYGAVLTKMVDPKSTERERHAMRKGLREAGLLDRLISDLKERTTDPDAQMALGETYLYEASSDRPALDKAQLVSQADEAFNAALALDERHWEARFFKARALSYWPSFTGKPAEAIRNFEILIAQQETQLREDRFVLPYILLGDLYKSRGESEKAVEIWRRGFLSFPADENLGKRLP